MFTPVGSSSCASAPSGWASCVPAPSGWASCAPPPSGWLSCTSAPSGWLTSVPSWLSLPASASCSSVPSFSEVSKLPVSSVSASWGANPSAPASSDPASCSVPTGAFSSARREAVGSMVKIIAILNTMANTLRFIFFPPNSLFGASLRLILQLCKLICRKCQISHNPGRFMRSLPNAGYNAIGCF